MTSQSQALMSHGGGVGQSENFLMVKQELGQTTTAPPPTSTPTIPQHGATTVKLDSRSTILPVHFRFVLKSKTQLKQNKKS